MIRIDEIYYNVFVKALQHQSRTAVHWFDPFGSKSINDLVTCPMIVDNAHRIIFWDQEPLYQKDAKEFFDDFCKMFRPPRAPEFHTTTTLVTSELNSEDVAWAQDTYKIENVSYYFFHGWAALDWYRGYNHSYLAIPWSERDISHRIFCPNNIVGGRRTHRLHLLSQLDQRDLLVNNRVSFPDICPYEKQETAVLLEKNGLPALKTPLPLIIDHQKNHANDSHRVDFWDQAQSCFCHVVTETVYQSNKLHLTEKTFKPIVLQQPFMMVAPKGSLAYLRSYGFQTFGDIWDEGYDQAEDQDRISLIADNLEVINNWTHAEILDAQQHVAGIVQHNHDWFYGEFQHVLWKELTQMVESWR